MQADEEYLRLLDRVLTTGERREDRTGVGTVGIFGETLRFDLSGGAFPLLTTKRLHWKSIVHELLWIISGSTNIAYLKRNGVSIWDEWADENGNLGPVYGRQLRRWANNTAFTLGSVDQLAETIEAIKKNPFSRRHIITLWNASELKLMRLPPCHGIAIQFNVRASGHLDLFMHQRSCDLFLGVPFNIASYALLLRLVAHVTGLKPGEFIWSGGDVHLYVNHLPQAREQLVRKPYVSPTVTLNPVIGDIDHFTFGDIQLDDYSAWPSIKAEVAV